VPGAIYDDDGDDRASDPQFGMTTPRWSSTGKTPSYANHSYHYGKQNQLHMLPSDDRQFVNKGHTAGTEPNFEKGSYFVYPQVYHSILINDLHYNCLST